MKIDAYEPTVYKLCERCKYKSTKWNYCNFYGFRIVSVLEKCYGFDKNKKVTK